MEEEGITQIKSSSMSRISIQSAEIEFTSFSPNLSPTRSLGVDPLLLTEKKVTENDLKLLRKKTNGKKLSRFYEEQNELIDDLLKPAHFRDEDEAKRLVKLKIAIYGTVTANVILFALQLYTAISSGSLALFSTMFDALMDVACNTVLLYTNWKAKKPPTFKFPIGMARLETAGIIVFSTLMTALSLQLIIEGIRSLASGSRDIDLSVFNIVVICSAVFIKFLLFLYCRALSQYPAAKVLAQDNFNDILLNLIGISLAVAASKTKWFIDPIGAIIIAFWILYSWIGTAYENVQLVMGKCPETPFLQRLTYLALTHDTRIVEVDTVRAYHSGSRIWTEVDIVLPRDMTLQEAHDIGESLQFKLETVENVERAFVHLDYESSHRPEHYKSF
ncbi:hypothetical protein HK098_002814 [Nowakowskiella sp. JEL0407]|nr:hypothetical protein HK098_002814 [Nowakowskiella sp. JEL0407]